MVAHLKLLWNQRPGIFIGAAVVVLAGAGLGAARLARPSSPTVPTAEVRRGEFVASVQLRGEVQALKSAVLTAPSSAGDIQIVKLVKNGTIVKTGDAVVQLDVSNLQNMLDQKRSELKQAEAEIEGVRAQARLQEEQDQTQLLKARYDVERARLEASKQEILSQIEGEKNKLKLADAEQMLRETEQKLASDRASAAADLASKKQKRDKALFEVRQAESNISKMSLKAPVDGMVTLLPNSRARAGFGSSTPEFKEGDRAWPGAAIAELPDLSTLRIAVRVDEADRGKLKPSQTGTVRVDAVPDKEFAARVVDIGPLAKPDFSSWPVTKNFDLMLEIDKGDPRLRPGMSATTRVAVERVPDSILIPPEAVFPRNGRPMVYVLRGSKFEERAIEVARRGEGQVAIAKGLAPGERVALKDPQQQEAK